MKKKILLGCLGALTIVCAVLLFTADDQSVADSNNSGKMPEQDRPRRDQESSGDVMIWELSRHFMTIE